MLLGLLQRQQTGIGGLIDMSIQEAAAVTVELANPYWFYPGALVKRQTGRHAQPEPTQPAMFRCADGWIYFVVRTMSDVEYIVASDAALKLETP